MGRKWALFVVIWQCAEAVNAVIREHVPDLSHLKAIAVQKTQKIKQNRRIKTMKALEKYVRSIPDFPQEGIIFRDITTVLQDADGFNLAIRELLKRLEGVDFDVMVGAESRGFIFGSPLAYELHKPFVLVRKKGKLPFKTVSEEYSLEYGTATLEMHTDSIKKGQRVVIVDDLIATGGTLECTAKLVERLGGEVVKILCLMELKGLNGRELLKKYNVDSVIAYEGK